MAKGQRQQAFESDFLAGFMEELTEAIRLRPRKASTDAFLDCVHAAANDEAAIPCMKAHVENFLAELSFLQRWLYHRFIVPRIPWREMAQRCRYRVLTQIDP